MSTHVCLTARAFGANNVYFPKTNSTIEKSVTGVTERFGGDFKIKEEKDWRYLVRNWDGDVIHLTMYGEDIDKFFSSVNPRNPLVILGSQKVPREVYDLADYNLAVGSQPHSEVAALAVLLDRLNKGSIPKLSKGKMAVLPSKEGKRVINYRSIPTTDECYRLLVKRGTEEGIMEHTMAVLQRTLELYDIHGGDIRLLTAGALLHDIGRTVTHGVEHGLEGGKIVREMGWDKELANIVERHVGGGITREEAESQGLPPKDYLPKTLEEKLVCHADNTAGGNERFEELLFRTEKAGFHASAQRMRLLMEKFG